VFGLFLGEIAVDHFAAPLSYYLTPMSTAWAVNIFRRGAGAEDYLEAETKMKT
jgi:hypothetical protein